jgi:hypothetical protein
MLPSGRPALGLLDRLDIAVGSGRASDWPWSGSNGEKPYLARKIDRARFGVDDHARAAHLLVPRFLGNEAQKDRSIRIRPVEKRGISRPSP